MAISHLMQVLTDKVVESMCRDTPEWTNGALARKSRYEGNRFCHDFPEAGLPVHMKRVDIMLHGVNRH